jgi:predicted glutamine amidotransferase
LDGSGFSEAIDSFDLAGPGVLIAHLRRPSFGTACNRNTHPFREGKYVFCHNGAVSSLKHEDRGTENESLKNDSWALFQKILGRIRGGESAEAAVLDTIAEVHAGDQQLPDDQKYTSLTSVLSDGKDVWVVRDVNSNRANPNAEYFTILLSTSTDLPGVAVACQEPIQLAKGMPYLSWKPMKTRELVVLRDGAIVKREPISD